MQPEARIAAAIDILDQINMGVAAEKCLTNWARSHRFAGSGDRAAIRDIVFDVLRRKRSYAWAGGGENGRALLVGRMISEGHSPQDVFTGEGYAPTALTERESAAVQVPADAPMPVQLDCPDWLWPGLQADLGPQAAPVLSALRDRAPVFLRVNLARVDRAAAQAALAEEDILTEPHDLAATALRVTRNERRIKGSRAFRDGLVELQDAASQAVVEACLEQIDPGRVLDYCAGGGGKALALADRVGGPVTAHDADPARMRDIPERARRAGVDIDVMTEVDGHFRLVLCDAPCSGSGAWRRQPEAKWHLTEDRLSALNVTQDSILAKAANHVGETGCLAYATCSLFSVENGQRADRFLETHPDWSEVQRRSWTPLDGADGFFLAVFRKS